MSDIQTPPEGTEPEIETPQTQEIETPQIPDEVVVEPAKEPQTEGTPPEPTPVDYKQKFAESFREGILNHERAKVAQSRIEELTKQDTPTDEAMRSLYPNWDELDSVSKNFFVKQEAQEMRQRKLEVQQQDIIARQRLEDEIESVMDDPKFSKLKGREAEFKRFALKPANRGLSAEVVAKAFLFDPDESQYASAPIKEALPTGSGGPREPLKPKKISIEEASEIRKTDYRRYKELLDANAIEEIE